MQRYVGEARYPIWLLGDSNPKNWQGQLKYPLDARHPARHNIWTPVLEEIQDVVYRERRIRLDSQKLYVRNAIANPDEKPKSSSVIWQEGVTHEVDSLRALLDENVPPLLISFGAFAFEFARRALNEPTRRYGDWTTRALRQQFDSRLNAFAPGRINLVPLLHTSIARGYFLSAHKAFCAPGDGNYFEVVGRAMGCMLLDHEAQLDIWIA